MNACRDCDGAGRTLAEDHDEHGTHHIDVTCEGCEGTGELINCRSCDEPIPAGDARVCAGCMLLANRIDDADERDWIGRWRQ